MDTPVGTYIYDATNNIKYIIVEFNFGFPCYLMLHPINEFEKGSHIFYMDALIKYGYHVNADE